MCRKLFGFILVLLYVVGFLSCQTAHHSNESHTAAADISGVHTQKPEAPIDKKPSLPIQLAIASFDPLISKGPGFPSHELTLQHYPEDTIGDYIVQFRGPALQKWKDDAVAAGALFYDYIHKCAFLVKMSYNTCNTLQIMGPVRWVGIYQPGYRIASDLFARISANENKDNEVLVSIIKVRTLQTLSQK